jgi:hypothetical protein
VFETCIEEGDVMELIPYFLGGAASTTNASEAFIRVRVTGGVGPTGYIAVYLPTGTQLVVRGRDLLRVESEASASEGFLPFSHRLACCTV